MKRDGTCRYLRSIWQPLTLFILILAFTIGFFTSSKAQAKTDSIFFCNADGNVESQWGHRYLPLWDPKLFFTINVSYGKVSFTAAKIIDACWDAVIGRGGQLLFATLAYRTLRRSLRLVLERNKVPITTLTAVYCLHIQIISVWELIRTTFLLRRTKNPSASTKLFVSKFRISAHVLICLYVLAFPTMVSVMTGYRAGLTGVFGYDEFNLSQLKPIDHVYRSQLILYEGNRIGLANTTAGYPNLFPEEMLQQDQINLSAALSTSGAFEEPQGTLFDCPYDPLSPTPKNLC